MGIDAEAFAAVPQVGAEGASAAFDLLGSIESAAAEWAKKHGLGPLFQVIVRSGEGLSLAIVPLGGPIAFTRDDGKLTAGFRSSHCGPGYHAAVVDLLDHVGRVTGLTWQWVDNEGDELDETGYATHRDFVRLQAAMSRFLHTLSGFAGQTWDNRTEVPPRLALCLPFGLGQQVGQAGCPLGFRDLSTLAGLQAGDDVALSVAAAHFFVWWHEGLDAKTWQQLLRAQLWQNAEWRSQVTDPDHLVLDQIRYSHGRITELGGVVPEDLEAAFQQYIDCPKIAAAPAAEGIGYRKYPVQQRLSGPWSIMLPGYLVRLDSDEGPAFEHNTLWLRTAAFRVPKGEPSRPFDWPDLYDGPYTEFGHRLCYRLGPRDFRQEHSVQSALTLTPGPDHYELLMLTLSSHLDWPFAAFGDWITSVTFATAHRPQPRPAFISN